MATTTARKLLPDVPGLEIAMEKILRTEGETEEKQHPGESLKEKSARWLKEDIELGKLCTWVSTHGTVEKSVRTLTTDEITFELEGVCREFDLYARRKGAPDDKRVCIHLLRD